MALLGMALAYGVTQPSIASAASFDCRRASNKVERLICSSPALSDLDGQMADAFKVARQKSKDKNALLADQRDWLKTRSMCALRGDRSMQIDCLISATEDRRSNLLGLVVTSDLPPEGSVPTMSNSIIGQRIQGRCHMEYCGWFSIEKRTIAGRAPDGVLYKIENRYWSSHHPDGSYETPAPLKDEGRGDWDVFCSLTRPAIIQHIQNEWSASTLSPNDASGIYGYNESAYIQYFAACHDVEITDVYDQMTALAKRLGYRVGAERVEQMQIADPTEYLQNLP